MAGMAVAISLPIWNLVWWRHTNLLIFEQLIFRKIIKIITTRCPILRLKGAIVDFAWDYAQVPVTRAYILSITALPRPPSWNEGALLLREGGEGKGRERGREGEGEKRGEGEKEGEGRSRKREEKGGEGKGGRGGRWERDGKGETRHTNPNLLLVRTLETDIY